MSSYSMSSIKLLFAEALAEKPGSYLIDEIFSRFPSLIELMNVTEDELTVIKGIGKTKARQILAALHLARRLNVPVQPKAVAIHSPQDAADLLIPELRFLQQEHFVVLFLNTKNRLIGLPETISVGTLNSAIVHPRDVFRAAVKRSAASIIACHNHPSGDTTPSPEDIHLTARLSEAGKIVGIDLLDHIIVGHGSFLSLKEGGFM
ncbi:RadC family protein [Cohnella soli]|uniref:DNA repair protein RadC n=1 Tax=Cohnella soli TaxID=425005 RepID=A0ABW0HVA4_9BACL